MLYSGITEEILKNQNDLKINLKIVKVLKEQKNKIMFKAEDMIVISKTSQEEIKPLTDNDKKAICKQIDKEIKYYTEKIGDLNIRIDELEAKQRETFESEVNSDES